MENTDIPAKADPFFREDVPSYVSSACVYDFNLFDPQYGSLDLFASIRRLHEIGLPDIFWTRHNGGHWIALRASAILEILKNPETFSSKRWHVPASMDYDTDFYVPFMSDPPEHTSYRQIARVLFSPKRILRLEAGIRAFTASLIDELSADGRCDFVADFARHMPVVVFLGLLDLPVEDRPHLLTIAEKVTRPPGKGHNRNDAFKAILDYLGPILEERRANPGEDILSELVHSKKQSGEPLSKDELYGMAAVLLTGGLDTVASSLCFMARYLAEEPAQRRRLIEDKAVILNAIEEMLRRFAVVTRGRRLAKDVVFNGTEMKSNDRIVWGTAMYGLDDRVNAQPLEVNFNRSRIQHEAFGYGIHFCIGAPLARLEFKIFLEEWLKRIPNFWIEPGITPEYRPGIIIGLKTLPLRWNVQ